MRNMKKIIRTIIYVLILSSLIMTGCGQKEEEAPIIMVDSSEIEVVFVMDEISKGEVVLTQKISCEYVQTEDQKIVFEEGGKTVDKVYVKVGDHVEEGDLLLTLDSGNIKDEIARLEYQIALNQKLLSYLDKYEEYDLQSEEYTYIYEYQSPSSYEEVAKHNHKLYLIGEDYQYRRDDYNDEILYDTQKLEKLKKEYEGNHVYATMSGKVIGLRKDLEGTLTKKDEVIMSIVDNDNGLFEIEEENAKEYFAEGQSVPMNIIYGEAKGEYELIPYNKSSWGSKQYFEVLSGPDAASLEVGVGGTIIATVDKKDNVKRIPNKALYEADGKYYTYVLNSDNMREARFLEMGLIGDEFSEVISGVDVGMKVVSR